MARRSLQLPRLIGSVLGLEALGIFMCQARLLFWRPENSGWPDAWTTYLWLSFAAFLLLVGYFVYRAHNWARLTVIGLCLCLGAFFLYMSIAAEVGWAQTLTRHNEWDLSSQVETVLDHFGRHLSLWLAPLVFIVGVLCHRDVAASFRPSIAERSNQAMQRTPTGSSPSASND